MIGYDGHHKKKGSKLHACVTPSSLPISIVIGPANEHEPRRLIPVMDSIRVKTLHSKGRTGRRPKRIHADRSYDTPLVRVCLNHNGVHANIPSRRGECSGRPRTFDADPLKKTSYTVERFFRWIQAFKRIDTRYDGLVATFMGHARITRIAIYIAKF